MEQPIRTAEVVGALSLATDLGTGQPLEHALRTAVLAVRLGELCTGDAAAAGQQTGHDLRPLADAAGEPRQRAGPHWRPARPAGDHPGRPTDSSAAEMSE